MKKSGFFIALFATIVQFYDYALFGLSAGTLARNFMPTDKADNQLLFFFAILGISVLARPIGALIFGYLGDCYSRSYAIKMATLLAIISTSSIAIIPNYSTFGIYSAILLTICRMLFLMSQAGEIDLTRVYIVERIGHYKNFAGGLVAFSSQSGALIAALTYFYSQQSTLEYFWKINFLLGGIGGIFVLLLRKYLYDDFSLHSSINNVQQSDSILKIIKAHRINFLLALIISGACGGSYHFLIIFFNTFAAKILLINSLKEAQILNIILISLYGISAIFAGIMADYTNPYKQIIISLIFSILLTLILKTSIINTNITLSNYLRIILVILMSLFIVPLQIIIQSLFSANIRVRMCSLSHSVGGMIFSSSVPFFSMLIWNKTNSSQIVINIYLILITIILTASIILFLRRKNTAN